MPKQTVDLNGKRFGRLTVIKFAGYRKSDYRATWECKCDCGNSKIAVASRLTSGNIRSCGCLGPEVVGARYRRHGMKNTAIYNIWAQLKGRCFNSNRGNYSNYGGRGITVCSGLLNFETFRDSIGPRPSSHHSVDRINTNSNYTCGECEQCKTLDLAKNIQWATPKQQARNRRNNRLITAFGITLTMIDWLEKTGMKYSTVAYRLKKGMEPEMALSKPGRR